MEKDTTVLLEQDRNVWIDCFTPSCGIHTYVMIQ